MAALIVNFTYLIETAVVAGDHVTVKFTLTSVTPALSEEFTESYPAVMYFENITPTMTTDAHDTQMDGNFRTLAQPTLEVFANKVRALVQKNAALPVDGATGVVSMDIPPVKKIIYAKTPGSRAVMVTWIA